MKTQILSTMRHSLHTCMLTAFFLLIGSFISVAQNKTLVATLTHNGDMTVFYGSDALSQAHSAAENGDVITLSPGSFTGITITKAVTLRGAGDDTQHYDNLTRIIDKRMVLSVDSTSDKLKVENICFESGIRSSNMIGGHFSCCSINNMSMSSTRGVIFEHCKLLGATLIYLGCNNSFISCVLDTLSNKVSDYVSDLNTLPYENSSTSSLSNCIIIRTGAFYEDYDGYYRLANSSFLNCIFVGSDAIDSSNKLDYCLIANDSQIDGITGFGNMTLNLNDISEVFENYSSTFTYTSDYHLSSFGATFLGSDGKQVGIYGGDVPFSRLYNYPVITKCEVGQRTDNNGMLTVDIEVSK